MLPIGTQGQVTAPTLMWVAAVDLLFEKLMMRGSVCFSDIKAISGSGNLCISTSLLQHSSCNVSRAATWECILAKASP